MDWAPCAGARLSIPDQLAKEGLVNVSLAIYLDSDTVVNQDILAQFLLVKAAFSSTQWAGLAQELGPWYRRGGRGPFPPPTGINSGVMVVDVLKWRQSDFNQFIQAYDGPVRLGDQDAINAYFAEHREEWYDLPCKYNYRTDTMAFQQTPGFQRARKGKGKQTGCHTQFGDAAVWHGNRGVMHWRYAESNAADWQFFKKMARKFYIAREWYQPTFTHQI